MFWIPKYRVKEHTKLNTFDRFKRLYSIQVIYCLIVIYLQFEAQTSFGSIYKTRIEGNSMFCDYYNAQQKVYCKRLKVLCPEHTKEPKVYVFCWIDSQTKFDTGTKFTLCMHKVVVQCWCLTIYTYMYMKRFILLKFECNGINC